MTAQVAGNTKLTQYIRYLHELIFSIYLPGLLIWANDASSRWAGQPGDRVPWVLQLKFWMTGDDRSHSLVDDPKLRVAFVFLWIASAAVLFLLLRILARLSFVHFFLHSFAGVVAVAGFPLAYLCARLGRARVGEFGAQFADVTGITVLCVSLLLLETAAVLLCAFLYSSGRWPRRTISAILVLVLHSGFWSFCAWGMRYLSLGGVPLFWPGYNLTDLTLRAPQMLYPWLGFLASLAWGLYAKLSPRTAS
jgi:hypothetical protein